MTLKRSSGTGLALEHDFADGVGEVVDEPDVLVGTDRERSQAAGVRLPEADRERLTVPFVEIRPSVLPLAYQIALSGPVTITRLVGLTGTREIRRRRWRSSCARSRADRGR